MDKDKTSPPKVMSITSFFFAFIMGYLYGKVMGFLDFVACLILLTLIMIVVEVTYGRCFRV
jgi:hypothetical protein